MELCFKTILIESQWNLKWKEWADQGHITLDINRITVEFKESPPECRRLERGHINRITVEFKDRRRN